MDIFQLKLHDLLNDKSKQFKINNNFGSWEELFADYLYGSYKQERLSKKFNRDRIVKKVIAIFLKLLITDLIYNHETYVLPYTNFGKIVVGINFNFKSKNYMFDPATEGLNFAPRIMFTESGYERVGQRYYMNFVPTWRRKMQKEIENGRRYEIQKINKPTR